MGKCAVVAASKVPYYYRYYPIETRCDSTIHQKKMTSAIRKAISHIENFFIYNEYLFHIDHDRSYAGDIMIGFSVSTWFADAKKANTKVA